MQDAEYVCGRAFSSTQGLIKTWGGGLKVEWEFMRCYRGDRHLELIQRKANSIVAIRQI